MNKKRFLFTFVMALMVTMTAFAQKRTFTGTVVDSNGEPLIGASVVQKGTTNGGITDIDGNYSVQVDAGSTLVFSYVGYETKELAAADGLKVVLADDSKMMDDVVVIGYGTQKKSVVTASIAKVSSEDLEGKTRLRAEDA